MSSITWDEFDHPIVPESWLNRPLTDEEIVELGIVGRSAGSTITINACGIHETLGDCSLDDPPPALARLRIVRPGLA